MKYQKGIVLLIFIFLTISANCQTEQEIKTTGKYIFSWALENNEITARESAKLGLMDTIFVSLLKESAIDRTDTIFIKVIDYFVNKVGFKWEAIAFADKSSIRVKLEQRKSIKVIPIVIGQPRKSSSISANPIEKKEVTQYVNSGVKTENEVDNNTFIKTGNPVLDGLLYAKDAVTLEKKLNKLRADLKLNYGARSNYPDDSDCYIFIIDETTLKVLAVYDKGTTSRRNFYTDLTDTDYLNQYKGRQFVYVVLK